MKYPQWAPPILVAQQQVRAGAGRYSPSRLWGDADFGGATEQSETYPLSWLGEHAAFNYAIERSAPQGDWLLDVDGRRLWQQHLLEQLSRDESYELLQRLITDEQMVVVWQSLTKRFADEREAFLFVHACEAGISGWRRDPKKTPAERKELFKQVEDAAHALKALLSQASEFDMYTIGDVVDPEVFDDYARNLLFTAQGHPDIPLEFDSDDIRRDLDMVFPPIGSVLTDIGEKARQYRQAAHSVKKPNSANAELHYFIRHLSRYCQTNYGQPLHQVVTNTAAVVFDRQDIDIDYVRKVLKR